MATARPCWLSRLRLAVKLNALKRNVPNVKTYFFFEAFLAFTAFFAGLLFLLVFFLADFFLPNAEDQLLLYDLLGPLRKMVIVYLNLKIWRAS